MITALPLDFLPRRGALAALLLCALAAGAQPARATPRAVGPADDWCGAINAAQPGEEIVLSSGDYSTPCVISTRGTAAQRTVIRSESEAAGLRATFNYTGTASNVIDLDAAAFITLRGFAFARTENDIDAIRIRQADDILIERNVFENIGGIAVPANTSGSTSARIIVRDNVFKNMRNTVIYFGCHSGNCTVKDAVIERNLIDGTLPGDGVGYGVQIKLNSNALIRDNTIYRTRGPGIMVYGSNNGGTASIIEGNYVEGAIDDANINAGGGPATIVNNITVGGGFAGIRAQDYAGRNLQRNVRIVHNTVLSAPTAGIHLQNWSNAGNVLANNAILPISGVPAISGISDAAVVTGNVTCTGTCFVNSANGPFDLLPAPGSALLGAARGAGSPWQPTDDFMGIPRGSPADSGAFERATNGLPRLVGDSKPRPPRNGASQATPTVGPNITATPVGPARAFLPLLQR